MPTSDFSAKFGKFQFRHGGKVRRRIWAKLARLLENGVRIDTALTTMRDRRVRLKSESDPVALALHDWSGHMRNGRKLSEAIEGWVSPEEAMLIAAGEQSGTLGKSLQSCIGLIDARATIRTTLSAGLMYPAMLMLATFGVLWLFGMKIIPGFARVVPEDRWTGVAGQMVQVSHFVQDWLWLVAVMGIGAVVLFAYSLPRWNGKLRTILDRHAPYSIYRNIQGATWLIAFAALVDAGIRVESALELLSAKASDWLKVRIQACTVEMRQGHSVGESLARTGYQFPDQETIDDLGVYSTISGFEEALSILGNDMLRDTLDWLKTSMTFVFNVGLITMAVVLSWMVSGMLAMQQQMGQVLRHVS